MLPRQHICETKLTKSSLVDSSLYESVLGTNTPKRIVAKVLKTNPKSKQGIIDSFYNEYEVSKELSHPRIRKVYAKTKLQNDHTLLMEYVKGSTLSYFGKVPDMHTFLLVATQITSLLCELHSHEILHMNISTEHIIYDGLGGTKLIGFRKSGHIDKFNGDNNSEFSFWGGTKYSSPEQAGALDRRVDHRSDLYSLGIVFYFMLTEKYPFQSRNIRELTRMHKEDVARPVNEVNSKIPHTISEMVSKLMNKMPDDRYQSAAGLLCDLKAMQAHAPEETSIVSNFLLGQRDCSSEIQMPIHLCGRKVETEIISDAYKSAASGGSEVIFITGSAGTGKSFLAKKSYSTDIKNPGYFVTGKFNQMGMERPYSGILQAVTEWCNLLLNEPQEKIELVRQSVIDGLGKDARILVGAIPIIQSFVGSWSYVVDDANLDEIRLKFTLALYKLLEALSVTRMPVFFLIDDLHFAEPESLKLIKDILMHGKINNFLFVGTCRNDESVATQSALDMITEINSCRHIPTHIIELSSFSKQDTEEMIKLSLRLPLTLTTDLGPLVDVIHQKTGGNAFHILEKMKSFTREKCLYFCHSEAQWKWNMDELKQKAVSENVARDTKVNLAHLPSNTQTVLKIASIIGNTFDVATLGLLTEVSYTSNLYNLANEGVLINIDNGRTFCFSHDLLHQAAYSLATTEGSANATHLRLARAMVQNMSQSQRKIFTIVNHFNAGSGLIEEDNEKEFVAALNIEAATEAKLESSFDLAMSYVDAAIDLLPENNWELYELSFKSYKLTAEISYINGDIERMNTFIDRALVHAKNDVDRAGLHIIRLVSLTVQNKFKYAVGYGLEVLANLGEPFSNVFVEAFAMYNFLKFKMIALLRGGLKNVSSLPEMKDPLMLAKLKIMTTVARILLFSNPKFTLNIVFRALQISLNHGASKHLAPNITIYTVVLVSAMGISQHAYELAQLCLDLLNKFPASEYYGFVYGPMYGAVFAMKVPLPDCIEKLQMASQVGLRGGDVDTGLHVGMLSCIFMVLSGIALPKIKTELDAIFAKAQKHAHKEVILINKVLKNFVLGAMGSSMNVDVINDSEAKADVEEILSIAACDRSNLVPFFYYEFGAIMAYSCHDIQKAEEMLQKGREVMKSLPQFFEEIYFQFIDGLVSLAMAGSSEHPQIFIAQAEKCIKKIREVSAHGSDTFKSKLHFLLAERAFSMRKYDEAFSYFDSAIHTSEKSNNLFEEAMACARAFFCATGIGDNRHSRPYYERALKVYKQWGAEKQWLELKKRGNVIFYARSDDH